MFVENVPPNFSITPVDRLISPPAPARGLPDFASSCTMNPLLVAMTMRGATRGVPAQYEIPRPPADGLGPIPAIFVRSDFHNSTPVSALSATMVEPWTGKYMTLFTTIGVTV